MQAAQQAGISRFVMLSSMFALQPEKWKQEPGIDTIIDYDIAKFFADHWLSHNTKLDWTIVQAGLLQETPGTGKSNWIRHTKAGSPSKTLQLFSQMC